MITIDTELFLQFLISGIIMGVFYCLMSLGINFIYGIMKVINWSMGQFFMIGGYVQYLFITHLIGVKYWYVGVIFSIVCTFVLGCIVQIVLIRPIFTGKIEETTEYATIVTIALGIFFVNLALFLGGPQVYSPPEYANPVNIGPLPISGSRFVALLSTIILLGMFYFFTNKTWVGKALRGIAQNRI